MSGSPSQRRAQLYRLLGDLPDRHQPIHCRVIERTQRDSYSMERLLLELNGAETVPALFAKPTGSGLFPCILFNHSHGGNYTNGKNELLEGREYLHPKPYVQELTSQGYAVLCIDHWLFGDRRGRSESELFKNMIWHGQVLWGMMVFDSIRAVDYLCTRQDVDSSRIATLGMSMGSNMAQWLAALDDRIKVCVDLCCLTDFDALIESRGLDGHGIYYYVPSLLKHFSAAEINALIAPRPHLSLAGNHDRLTPPAGLDRIDQVLKAVYSTFEAPSFWQLLRYETAHFETAEMRVEVMRWLQRHL